MKITVEKDMYADFKQRVTPCISLTRLENKMGVFDYHFQFKNGGMSVFAEFKIIESMKDFIEIRASQIEWSENHIKNNGTAFIILYCREIKGYLLYDAKDCIKMKSKPAIEFKHLAPATSKANMLMFHMEQESAKKRELLSVYSI